MNSLVLNSLVLNGGKGSGDHGHAGRPGKRGGSAPKGAAGRSSGSQEESKIAWGGDVKFGSEAFQKAVAEVSSSMEKEYGVALDKTRVLKQNVMESYYGNFGAGVVGRCKMNGTGKIDVSFRDREANLEDMEKRENDRYNTDSSVKGTIRHELGHAIIGQLAQKATANIEVDYAPIKDENANEAYRYINLCLANVARETAKKTGMNISKYSRKDPEEKFAGMSEYAIYNGDMEIVAESLSNPNYSAITKAVSNEVKELSKRISNGNFKDMKEFYRGTFSANNISSKAIDLCVGYRTRSET